MTKAEAYRFLGTSRSVARFRAERLYQQKCRHLQLQMVPGMPVAIRQRAQVELAQLDAAWRIITAAGAARSSAKKPTTPKTPTSARPRVPPRRKSPAVVAMGKRITSAMPYLAIITAVMLALVVTITLIKPMKGNAMGLLTSFVLGFIHLFLVAVDILFVLMLTRMLSYRWQARWLAVINATGKPAVDWFAGRTARVLDHIGWKVPSERAVLFIGMLAISIMRLLVAASLGR